MFMRHHLNRRKLVIVVLWREAKKWKVMVQTSLGKNVKPCLENN
jgi:hypothetical protein